MSLPERLFKLSEHGTSVRTELLAGLTTFLTMSYIVFVNPAILGTTGMDPGAVFVATCLAAALGSAVMGLAANFPVGMAPGMGLNAFFAFTVVGAAGLPWQQALAAVLISGIVFLVLSLTGVRSWLVAGIPPSLRSAIVAGIGLFLAIIALQKSNVVIGDADTLIRLGPMDTAPPLLAMGGFLLIAILEAGRRRRARRTSDHAVRHRSVGVDARLRQAVRVVDALGRELLAHQARHEPTGISLAPQRAVHAPHAHGGLETRRGPPAAPPDRARRLLLVGGVDPADHADPVLARTALDAVPFLVSLEVRHSEVTDRADVVLPVAPPVEKAGTFVTWEGRPRPFPQALTTTHLSDFRVLDRLADALGADLGLRALADVHAEGGLYQLFAVSCDAAASDRYALRHQRIELRERHPHRFEGVADARQAIS